MASTEKWVTLLSKCRKDRAYREKVNRILDELSGLIASGHDDASLKKELRLNKSYGDIYLEIAKARIKVSEKFSKSNRLWLDLYSASYSTPEIIGKYRSSRVSGGRIIDVGSGAGLQSIMFAENFPVIGIETRRERVEMSYLNSEVYGVKNAKFINADYVSVIDNLNITSEDIIFSDPLRPRTEEKRTLDSVVPSPLALMKLASQYTKNFVFDLPPQMRWEEITIDGEKEYISINGRMNRLTLYTGSLSKGSVSAVMLPSGIKLRGEPSEHHLQRVEEAKKYLYLPDPSVLYAKLVHSIPNLEKLRLLSEDKRRLILTSDELLDEGFPGDIFEVLLVSSEKEFYDGLSRLNAGESFLKFQIEPNLYYEMKKGIDERLSGTGAIYIFRDREKYIVGKRAFSS